MKRLAYFIALGVIWLLLTWSLDLQELLAGVVLAVGLAFILARLYPDRRSLSPMPVMKPGVRL